MKVEITPTRLVILVVLGAGHVVLWILGISMRAMHHEELGSSADSMPFFSEVFLVYLPVIYYFAIACIAGGLYCALHGKASAKAHEDSVAEHSE